MATDTDYAVLAAVEHLRAALGRDPMVSEINRHLPEIKRGTIAKCVQRMSKDGRLERIENGARPRYRVPEDAPAEITNAQRAALMRLSAARLGTPNAPSPFTAFFLLATAHVHAAARVMLDPSDGQQVFSDLADITEKHAEWLTTLRGDLHGWHLSAIGLARLDRIVATTFERGEDAVERLEAVKHLAEQIREAMNEQRE